MTLREQLLVSFEDALRPVGLLDRFQVSGVVATRWGDVQNDLETIAARGFLGLIEAWEVSILTAMEDKKNEDNPFDHRLVRRLLPEYLEDLSELEAKKTAAEVALAYKSLWRVERTFRETKSTLDVRPIFHQRDDTTIGHIMSCFLALRLEVDLQQRLDDRGTEVSWPNLMRDLTEVRAVELSLDEQRYRLRTELRGSAFGAFQAAGVRPPPTIE
ncbi:MAG TPA: hypothetical protein RMH99_00680, partial [Sandaracinaceae bacterium LLY-WYZ-13_1]|nr:hypothetical protein [Sandaracinaceae bacterium LLY-WYZ-13_1]